jgi:NAD(P)-dependent dehydrogenase (short-subunit alcohol dehydrogenase family)
MATQTILIVGASRGLGLGLAQAYAASGWRVIGTVRNTSPSTGLHALATEIGRRVSVEVVDITIPSQVASLRERLAGERIDILFVNAGISNGQAETVADTSTEAFINIMLTNALSPMRVIEALADLVPEGGVIAAMSSGLGSVAMNNRGGWECYRASKAALNTMLRSFSVRRGDGRTILAVAPGWVRTDMGGPNATLDIGTSAQGMMKAIAARRGKPGPAFIEYLGTDVPW